nr:zinc transporter ZIP3-like [Leptinotarsa decemlineata]
MDLQSTKILVAVLFSFVRFFFGILPVKLYKCLRKWEGDDGSGKFVNNKRHTQVNCAIALCQSFGGGVLFATCFLHMMLEVYQSVEDLKKFGNLNTNYPLSQLTISLGFFLVYFLEELSHWVITRIPDKPYPPIEKKFNNFTNASVTPIEEDETKNSKAFLVEDEYEKTTGKCKAEEENVTESEEISDANMLEKGFSVDNHHENIVYDSLSFNSDVARNNRKNLDNDREIDDVEEIQEEVLECEIKSQQQIMRYILIVVALSFHAIFEGLAIGLQHSIANIWYLFIAVSIHSATILFCIGLELLLARAKTKFIYYQMLALAFASPFGVFLGLLVTIKSDIQTRAKSIAVVFLEGLSAGTILYITFFEILNREKERRVYRIPRAICILAGFFLMAFLQSLEVYD